MIQVEELTKNYGTVAAVRGLTFTVQRGEIVGFLGPNGAGKTTTMRMLTGYLPPTTGRASIAGYDTFEQSLQARQRIGYLPESVPLYTEMSVGGYLNFMARLRGVTDVRAAVQRAMELVNITDRANMLIGKLSKGYRQRVGLAQALVHSPDVLILDEPTIGLDPRQIIEVRELVQSLAGQHTVLLSTHILPEVEQICTRVLIMNKGQIVAEDAPKALSSRLRSAESVLIEIDSGEADVLPVLQAVPHVQSVISLAPGRYEIRTTVGQDMRAHIAAAVVGQGWGLLGLAANKMSLEDIFLQLTREEAPAPVAEEAAERVEQAASNQP
jgi:ABC-2 type transport system ATP-binding protein